MAQVLPKKELPPAVAAWVRDLVESGADEGEVQVHFEGLAKTWGAEVAGDALLSFKEQIPPADEIGAQIEAALKPKAEPAIIPPQAAPLQRRVLPSMSAVKPSLAVALAAANVNVKPLSHPSVLGVAKPAPLVSWDAVVVPSGASELEALTYVPGVVGKIVDWIAACAICPSRMMALGVALGVIGTLVGRRTEGPTGSATHLFVFLLAPTGTGKDHPFICGRLLMCEAGAEGLIAPGDYVSGQGLKQHLKDQPLSVAFVDEIGDMFGRINSQKENTFVRDLMPLFKQLYNPWGLLITAPRAHEKSITIPHPAFSLLGTCTPEDFFGNLLPSDVSGGFANRLMLLPYEKRPKQLDIPEGAKDVPADLTLALKRLAGKDVSVLDQSPTPDASKEVPKDARRKIRWADDAAKAEWCTFIEEMDQQEQVSVQRFQLSMRVAENAIRCATILAVGRGSATVSVRDMRWAITLARVSFEFAAGGFAKYMREFFEFPKFCDEVYNALVAAGGWMSNRDIQRTFGRNQRFRGILQNVLDQLKEEVRIKRDKRNGGKGPLSDGWEVID